MKQYFFIIGLAFLCLGAASSYYPFENTDIGNNVSMFISLEGTVSHYANEPTLYININGEIEKIDKGACKDWSNYRVCYINSELNLSAKKGKFHRVFGKIPVITLDIEKLTQEVKISLNTNQSYYFPSQRAKVTFTLDNQGIDMSQGKFYITSSKPIVLLDPSDFTPRSHTLFVRDMGKIREDEQKTNNLEFVVTDVDNITFTAWTQLGNYTSEKQKSTVVVKNPLDISLSVKDDTLGYDDWFEGELTVKQNADFVLLKNMLFETDLLFNDSTKERTWENEYMHEGFTLPFKIHALKNGDHFVRISAAYEQLQKYEKVTEVPLEVSIYRPPATISFAPVMKVYETY